MTTDWPALKSEDFTVEECGETTDGCDATSEKNHWFCTRAANHPMPHVAGTGSTIVAVWDDERCDDIWDEASWENDDG